jgi:two-component system chemotaxis response regulator CheY
MEHAGKRVLIVDDSSFMRTALKIILEKLGYVVVGTAENGIDAVAKYRDLEPDVVTLDIVMPQMDGVQTLKLLRSVDPNAVVVMVSSLTDQEAGVECAKAGATQYLLKPFDQTKVAEVMQRVAAQRRAA